jgi:DNA processing protein
MTQEANTLPTGSVSVLSPSQLSPGQLHDWLRLLLAPGIGVNSLHSLLEHYDDASKLLAAISNKEIAVSKKVHLALTQPQQQTLQQCLAWQSANSQHHVISCKDSCYPQQLKEIADAPLLLFVDGNPASLQQPQLAIVGSRKATPAGLETSREFARVLTQQGLTISSGLALGIDGSAHLGALQASGQTIAILANGLDKIYPARHQTLANDILASGGALISEFPPGTPPLAKHFPRRNRIISGLSLGVLVVEAAIRSGSLITARLAGEQGREVFAMPGSIHNPLARGCHKLLREGAVLVEKIDDILCELPINSKTPAAQNLNNTPITPPSDPAQQALLGHMGYDPVDTDTLVTRSGLTAEQVSSMLLLLELQGSVAAIGGGRFQRCDTKR